MEENEQTRRGQPTPPPAAAPPPSAPPPGGAPPPAPPPPGGAPLTPVAPGGRRARPALATPGAAALRPLTLGDVLDGMFRLMLRHWRAYLVAVGVLVVPLTVLATWLQADVLLDVGLLDILNDPLAAQQAAAADPALAPLSAGVTWGVVLETLVAPLIAGTVTVLASAGLLAQEVSARDALVAAVRRYPALLGVLVLLGLAVLLVVAPLFLLIVPLAFVFMESPVLAVVGILLLIALAVAAGVVVYTLFLLATPALILERLGPLAAIRRSVGLVRRRFWPVLGTYLLVWLIVAVIAAVIGWPFGLPAILLGGPAALVATAIGAVIVGILTTPLTHNAVTLIYYDQRVRSEALDLEGMTAAMEAGEGEAPA